MQLKTFKRIVTMIFAAPHLVYRIAWHIDDPQTYYNFGLTCKVARNASIYWKLPKQTEFTKKVKYQNRIYPVLPNGEIHGPMIYTGSNISSYYHRGFMSPDNMHPEVRYFHRYEFFRGKALIYAYENVIVFGTDDHSVEIGIRGCPECGGFCYYCAGSYKNHHNYNKNCEACRKYVLNE